MNDAEFQKLLNAKSPLVLAAHRGKAISMTIFLLILLMISISLHTSGLIFLIFVFLAINIYVLINPQSRALLLTSDHFAKRIMGTKSARIYNWKDVSEFKAEKNGIVSFSTSKTTLKNNTSFENRFVGMSRIAKGYTDSLKSVYIVTTPQLAQLMNHWRERALKRNT